jgi:UDP-N-acetylmuramate dehydrogenase
MSSWEQEVLVKWQETCFMDNVLYKKIQEIKDVELTINQDLYRLTTMRLHVSGDFALVKNVTGLKELILLLNENNYKYRLVGWGANQILSNTENTLFIKIDFEFNRDLLKEKHEKYVLPASVPLNILTTHAKKFGLKGWEVFTGVPASLGGAIFMNAGTNLGEIGEIVESVQVLRKNGDIEKVVIDDTSFSYRECHFLNDGDVILEATLTHHGVDNGIGSKISEYMDLRKKTQPLSSRNCGCVFKNASKEMRAGHMIDLLGLKGLKNENVQISHLHANFFENFGDAKASELIEIIDAAQAEIEQYTGIKFELEVNLY